METIRIGQAAKKSGVGVETIRFYERAGLLKKPSRTPSGYRIYPQTIIGYLEFIKEAKALGFSLAEIKDLLSLRIQPNKSCADVKAKAQEKLSQIEEKLARLSQMKDILKVLIRRCKGKGPVSECPILEGLEKKGGET